MHMTILKANSKKMNCSKTSVQAKADTQFRVGITDRRVVFKIDNETMKGMLNSLLLIKSTNIIE
jgi:hypothetical protein